ncbi:hypothetical protein D5066_07330 [Enterobacter chuandaensis]|nr:hypothetical protein D5066_07330 [Enterobacter chuandaensis]
MLRVPWSGTVTLKGNSNCNNYRREYWIMCVASRTMSAYFCHNEGKRRHTCRRTKCHHSVKKLPWSTKPCSRAVLKRHCVRPFRIWTMKPVKV